MSTTIKLLSMQPKIRLLVMTLSVILLSFVTTLSFAQIGTPTLTSDKQDYAPMSTATLRGSGFIPGEKVKVQVVDYLNNGLPTNGDNETNPLHDPWEVTADENGNFITTWYVDEYELGLTLKATADGLDPALPARHAETFFTDANDLTIYASDCITAGTTFCLTSSVCVKTTNIGGGLHHFEWFSPSNSTTPAHSSSSNSSSLSDSYTPTEAGSWTVKLIKDANGSSDNTKTFTVAASNTASLSSASGTDNQTKCINNAITTITYNTTGATGIGLASGLPGGVIASFSSNTISISGTPTASGTFNYSIPLTGGCGAISVTGTITVRPDASITSVTAGTTPQCIGGTTTYTVSGVELGGGTGAWSSSNTAIATVDPSTGLVTAVSAGTVNIIYTVTSGCGGTKTSQQSYRVKTPTTISFVSPNASWTYGCTTATLSVVADGEGTRSYQWHHKYTTGGINDENVGTNSSNYTVPELVGAGTHEYWVIVTAECGTATSTHVIVTINPQEADAANEGEPYYTGPATAFTANATSNTATFTMSAFVKNKDGGTCGDIATARVSFFYKVSGGTNAWNKVPNGQNLPVNYVDPANPSKGGVAAVIAQLNIGNGTCETFDVLVTLSGNYTGRGDNEQSQVFISKPLPGGTISGGAKISGTNSVGFVKGPYKSELSFFVNYTVKAGKAQNPKGKVNLTVKSKYDRFGNLTTTTHLYKITSNAIASLVVGQPSIEKATFTSKANIAEIINAETGELVPMEGNCTMVMDLVDLSGCDNNTLDKIGVVVYRNSGGIWYANNFDITNGKTVPTAISSGCVWISTSGLTSCSLAPSTLRSRVPEQTLQPTQFSVNAYPNPTNNQFTLKLESDNLQDKISVRVFDITGKAVQTFTNLNASQTLNIGASYRPGTYILEMIQGTQRKQFKLVKIPD